MTFWIIIAAMSAIVALLLARAVARGAAADVEDTAAYDLRVYRDQLAEVERDVSRGVLPEDDAERMRTEISRRILAADAASDGTVMQTEAGPQRIIWTLIATVLIAGSLALYAKIGAPGYGDLALEKRIALAEDMRRNRPDQRTAENGLPSLPVLANVSQETKALMEQLRATVARRPNDLRGHRFLAQYEARIGNFAAAARAQERVLVLRGESVTAQDFSDFAELLVLAAGGYVSPEAETALRETLARDEQDGRARYYIGLMMIQTGRPDVGFRMWDALLRRGPEDAPWITPIKDQILSVAALAGVTYDIPAIGPGAATGPSAEDFEAASAMSADERLEMIGAMVDGLSDRLANEGGPATDWARLITSLGVLSRRDQALAVYKNAIEVFGGNPGALDAIKRAGQQAGVAE